jgi:hypothetical protein
VQKSVEECEKKELEVISIEWRAEGVVVPEWELLAHTPAVFVRAANKGVAGYGTWKSVRKMEDTGKRWREESEGLTQRR